MIGRISQFMCNVRDLTDHTPTKIVFPAAAMSYFQLPYLDDERTKAIIRARSVDLCFECGCVTIEFEEEHD